MNRQTINKSFLGVTILGTLFVSTETVLHATGRSLCSTAGCAMVASTARFGDASILFIGLALFAALTALAVGAFVLNRHGADRLIDPVLIVALAAEGFFTGYQAFRLFTPCLFCLAVFAFLVSLGLLRLLSGNREIAAGFGSLVAVFALFYLVLPVQAVMPIPDQKELILFYSKDCKYCTELKNELERKQVTVDHVLVTQYSGLLKSMGIDRVPTLYVNKDQEKMFITGKDRIERYLSGQEAAGASPRATDRPGDAGAPHQKSQQVNPFDGGDNGLKAIMPPSEEGICRDTEPCK
jgi:glutaredoxin